MKQYSFVRTKDEAMRLVEKRVGRHLLPPIQEQLIKERYIDEILEGEEGALERTVARVKELENLVEETLKYVLPGKQAFGKRRNKPVSIALDVPPIAELTDNRGLAVSELLALHARSDPGVRKFRQKFLEGKLLKEEEVENWILNHATPSSPPLYFFNYPVQGKLGLFVGRKSVVGFLSSLARRLGKYYGWSEHDAIKFVLTDTPPPSGIKVRRKAISPFVAATMRLVLDVPLWATEKEVLRAFRHAKKGLPKPRRIGEKALTLVSFVAERIENGKVKGGWRKLLREWNDKHPQFRYSSPWRMASDYRRAEEALLLGTPRFLSKLYSALGMESKKASHMEPAEQNKLVRK
jgi:hypothetical protein